jgi:hypothetical protein
MSTTIYNGKRLPEMSVYELNEFYKRLRGELIPMAKREYYKLIVKVCQEIYVYLQTGEYPGHYDLNLNEIKENRQAFKSNAKDMLIYAQDFVNNTVRKTSAAVFTYDSESDADFDVSLVVIPIDDKILCMPYANHGVLYDALTNRSELSDYGYWNNTDKPKDISESEWEQRKHDWDKALPRIGVPKENGIVLHIVDAVEDIIELNHINVRQNFMCFLMDDDELLTKVANGVILNREYNKLIEKYTGGDQAKAIQVGMKCLRLATEHIKNHPDEVEVEKENYKHMFNSKEFFSLLLTSTT